MAEKITLASLQSLFTGDEWNVIGRSPQRLSNLIDVAPKAIQTVVYDALFELKNVISSNAKGDSCLNVLQLNMADFIKETYQNRAQWIRYTNKETFEHFRNYMSNLRHQGRMSMSIKECMDAAGSSLASHNSTFHLFDGQGSNSRRDSTVPLMTMFMSAVAKSIIGDPDAPAYAKEQVKALHEGRVFAMREKVYKDFAVSFLPNLLKFGLMTMMTVLAWAPTMLLVGTGVALFTLGAKIAFRAAHRLWRTVGWFARKSAPKKATPGKGKGKGKSPTVAKPKPRTWAEWLAQRMGRKERHLAHPTAQDRKRETAAVKRAAAAVRKMTKKDAAKKPRMAPANRTRAEKKPRANRGLGRAKINKPRIAPATRVRS
jgi:hypothetical protein